MAPGLCSLVRPAELRRGSDYGDCHGDGERNKLVLAQMREMEIWPKAVPYYYGFDENRNQSRIRPRPRPNFRPGLMVLTPTRTDSGLVSI